MRTGLAVLVCASVALVTASVAEAGTIELRYFEIVRQNFFRDQSQNPTWVSRDDCLADDVFTFPLSVTGHAGYNLEIWASSGETDCQDPAARHGSTAVCWQVGAAVPVLSSIEMNVRVRDIVGMHSGEGPGAGTIDDCTPVGTSTAARVVLLNFMLVDPADQVSHAELTWGTKFDLWGPTAPRDVIATGFDGQVVVDWEQPNDVDLTGYLFLCDPSPDAGADGCGPTSLVQGTLADPAYVCGVELGVTKSTGAIKGMTHGAYYHIAVAAADGVGNAGMLSNVVCVSPKASAPKAEESAGCSFAARPAGVSGFWLIGFGALAWGARRKRR